MNEQQEQSPFWTAYYATLGVGLALSIITTVLGLTWIVMRWLGL